MNPLLTAYTSLTSSCLMPWGGLSCTRSCSLARSLLCGGGVQLPKLNLRQFHPVPGSCGNAHPSPAAA